LETSTTGNPCQCGCEGRTKTRRGRFLPGHHLKNQTRCKRGHDLVDGNVFRQADGRRYCRQCHSERVDTFRRSGKKNRTPHRAPEARRFAHIKSRYGLTREQWQALFDAQGGKCPICEEAFTKTREICVDHDHECCRGKVTCGRCIRGLVCIFCNHLLHALDNKKWFDAAQAYQARYRQKRGAA
jgi:hypothetical protein